MLNLLRELTDPELILLVYYSKPITSGSDYHKQLREKHPEILQPVSREMGMPQEEIDHGALQDCYGNTLGLLRSGFLGCPSMKNLLTKGMVCPKSAKIIHFEGNFCYPGSHKTIWFRKEKPFRD
jgi:hypothetical protein